ncbi:MAG: hypothetical protein HS129_08700 [Leptospiraceae bacterium]|nr:hypothetical protein [Leptospiraceae bacterium]NUM42315.1 hypothetical protein [Leptospiraceae bacterium]
MSYKNSTIDLHNSSENRGAFWKLFEKNLTETEVLKKSLVSLDSNVAELHRKISKMDSKFKTE